MKKRLAEYGVMLFAGTVWLVGFLCYVAMLGAFCGMIKFGWMMLFA